jgi:polyphosphate kinase
MSHNKEKESIKTEEMERSIIDLDDPRLYINREINWLDFNYKVLEEAMEVSNPLLEKLKFLGIFYNNLDEFFMVRVAGLVRQYKEGVSSNAPDQYSPAKQLTHIRKKLLPHLGLAQDYWKKELCPALHDAGILITSYKNLTDSHKRFLKKYFEDEIYPVLTPQAIDPGRPFPRISGQSLNFLVQLNDPYSGIKFARVKIPKNLSRFVFIPRNKEAKTYTNLGFSVNVRSNEIILVEDLIAQHLDMLFPGLEVMNASTFRITRNTDLEIEEDEAHDLLEAVEDYVEKRSFGEVIRLEIKTGMPSDMYRFLMGKLRLAPFQIYKSKLPLAFSDFLRLYGVDRPDLKYAPYIPRIPAPFMEGASLHPMIREKDVFIYHPYDSFSPVLEFVRKAARDPKVLAIKQTLYRVGKNSPIVKALMEARRNGKQVTAMVELKARFDEEQNITWARALEDAGVHVVYGLVGYKIHAKLCLVLRKESTGVRRYVHIGTGNYNPDTAKIYTDMGLFTCDPDICADVTDLFNAMTGYSYKENYRKLLVSPISTRTGILQRIEREIKSHQDKGNGYIVMKMNQLVDKRVIKALYRASMAGVKVRLQVRGICCLIPGIDAISDNIEVTSIVGRFLEHSRIYYFRNGGNDEMFIGSADMMPRNLDRRIEVLTPIEDPNLRNSIRSEILEVHLNDNVKARRLRRDGNYEKVLNKGSLTIDSQELMMGHEGGWNYLGEEE